MFNKATNSVYNLYVKLKIGIDGFLEPKTHDDDETTEISLHSSTFASLPSLYAKGGKEDSSDILAVLHKSNERRISLVSPKEERLGFYLGKHDSLDSLSGLRNESVMILPRDVAVMISYWVHRTNDYKTISAWARTCRMMYNVNKEKLGAKGNRRPGKKELCLRIVQVGKRDESGRIDKLGKLGWVFSNEDVKVDTSMMELILLAENYGRCRKGCIKFDHVYLQRISDICIENNVDITDEKICPYFHDREISIPRLCLMVTRDIYKICTGITSVVDIASADATVVQRC